MPTFDIILTTFNRTAYTKRTVASLFSTGAFSQCQRFIIVDNHSLEEEMQDFLMDMRVYAKVFVLYRPTNDGWATAVNDALGVSRAEFVLLSNNDVEYKPEFLETMFYTFKTAQANNESIGILAGWKHTGHGFVKGGVHNQWFREMDDIPAVAWLMPKTAMEKVGMLPEKGPCLTKGGNGEDTEYVQRMKAAGLLTGAVQDDVATHIDGY